MAGKAGQKDGRGVIQLLDEAVHLLRRAPRGALACYCIGALPFVMAAMYFWADMSRSGLAHTRLPEASGALGVLFIWMKCWQSAFAAKLHAALCGYPQPQWTFGRIRRIIVSQTIIQPWGLIVLPIVFLPSNIVLRPAPYAFFQNVCVLAGAGGAAQRDGVVRVAWRQASLWPRQNMLAGVILKLFGLFVFINIIQAILLPPYLLKTLLNVETVFSRGGFSELNTTFLAIALGLTYLCLDPIVKAFFTLRCFYGTSLATGQDLHADLRRAAGGPRTSLASTVIAIMMLAACAAPAVAADAPDTPSASQRGSVEPDELGGFRRREGGCDEYRVLEEACLALRPRPVVLPRREGSPSS